MRTHGGAIPVYGPTGKDIPGCSTVVHEGDKLEITQPRISLKVSEVPGHTLSHVAYFANMQANVVEPMLFCGDTLFACGCGRLFEGSPKQMSESLPNLLHCQKILWFIALMNTLYQTFDLLWLSSPTTSI